MGFLVEDVFYVLVVFDYYLVVVLLDILVAGFLHHAVQIDVILCLGVCNIAQVGYEQVVVVYAVV